MHKANSVRKPGMGVNMPTDISRILKLRYLGSSEK